MEILLGILAVLAFITVVGHLIWLALAATFRFLFAIPSQPHAEPMHRHIAEGELHDHRVRLGIGRAVQTLDARRSFHEARCALEAVAFGLTGSSEGNGSAPERPKVATYKDLGSFQLLLSLQDDEALRRHFSELLPELPEPGRRAPVGKPEASEWFVRMLDAPLSPDELVELGAVADTLSRKVAVHQ